jgi:amino acid transporter
MDSVSPTNPEERNPQSPQSAGISDSQSAKHLGAGESHQNVHAALDEKDTELGIDTGGVHINRPTLATKVRTFLVGKPRDLTDHSVFHSLSLIAFYAWVGLGADGLSSSCYGPSEAFAALKTDHGDFTYLAVFLALATAVTVFVISACYSHIIEVFPSGGGGYLVASKMLGPKIGVISGCALLVDYALTITTSIAAAGDAVWGLMHFDQHKTYLGLAPDDLKIWFEASIILLLIILNLRGVKESVTVLMPIFLAFLVLHAVLIGGAILMHIQSIGDVAHDVVTKVNEGAHNPDVGILGMLSAFFFAYSLGAGTYTGIEAVSNSMPVMREPRVATGKRTMRYMAISLAVTAGGLMLAYLLLRIPPIAEGEKTMNQLLSESFAQGLHMPEWLADLFVYLTILSEGCLLFVAAQAGFIDGPRVLANMARDSWLPHWFANLSERLAAHNGVILMGLAGMSALVVTGGKVSALLVMYSINVFVTFSLSLIGMCRHWWLERGHDPIWKKRFALFAFGTAMCLSILSITVFEKFKEGGYRTIMVTAILFVICLLVRRYYDQVRDRLGRLNALLEVIAPPGDPIGKDPDHEEPTAAVLVGGYSGLGVHTFLNALRFGPGKFSNVVFLSVGVVDSGNFKGADAVDELTEYTKDSVNKFVDHAQRIGLPSAGYFAIGTDPVDELERLCVEVKKQYPRSIFFAGQLVFQRDTWYQRILHNETAYSLQRRLQWDGVPMVILPTRVM